MSNSPLSPDALAFEAALRANPDDLAGWCAYADYLTEQGDPRGEFMSVQIALEDESRPKEERDALKEKEAELLARHEKEWVGSWADVVAAPEGKDESRGQLDPTDGHKYRFSRGWVTGVNVGMLLIRGARAIIDAPELRLVRDLFVGDVNYDSDEVYDDVSDLPEREAPPDAANLPNDNPSQWLLVRWAQLPFLRRLTWGWPATDEYEEYCPYSYLVAGEAVTEIVRQMPNVEELRLFTHGIETRPLFALPMPHLRVLQVYHLHEYPLELLAENASLSCLEKLLIHSGSIRSEHPYIRLEQLRAVCRSPHLVSLKHLQLRLTDFGDEGAEEIVASGILKRLKALDLRHGCMTDVGAQALAACPDLKNLDFLDVSRNALTDVGIAALQATGVKFDTRYQHGQGPGYDGPEPHYLYAGDCE